VDPDFAKAISKCLAEIPDGQVATCGTIARALGDVRAARAVATWLVEHPGTPRGHRVVRADGRPVLAAAEQQLGREGFPMVGGRVDESRIVASLADVEFLGVLRAEQQRLASKVIENDDCGPIKIVAGVDVAYQGEDMYAAAASVALADLETVEVALVRRRVDFPYIPTYLAYREFPAIEAAVRRLSTRPDALMIDGHGRLHPALFGVACDAGVRLDLPTIGVAKHPLAGRVQPTSEKHEDVLAVRIDGVTRGYAWTPPNRSRAIYVSVGHRVSLQHALDLVRKTTRDRYPEALRIADRISRNMKGNEKREKGAAR
jgi:deoxyribonuclease V